MIHLDTSAIIRFLTKDDPKKGAQVKKLIDSKKRLCIHDVVFPEIEYVLSGNTYNYQRDAILTAYMFLANKENIKVTKETKMAVEIYKNTKLDMADCIIVASSTGGELMSFDKDLLVAAKKVVDYK
jgi:predicted nucleic-acid-binding protein